MTTSTKRPDGGELKPCPFCDKPLYVKRGTINPYARCTTENCFGAKMPVVSLDVPADVEAWNTRTPANESPAPQAPLAQINAAIAKLTFMTNGVIGRDWRSQRTYVVSEKGSEWNAILDAIEALRVSRSALEASPAPQAERPYGEVLDEMDHQAKYQSATVDNRRNEQLRIQALGAAISRRDWHATEIAYGRIRDAFDSSDKGETA